jgi:hypothetical protein
MEAWVAILIGFWREARETGVIVNISFAHHGALHLGELTRQEARGSQSPMSDQQIDHQHDQQNTADPDAAAISPPGIRNRPRRVGAVRE